MIGVELPGDLPQLLFGALGVGLSPGPVEFATDQGALILGQVVEYVFPLVLTAAGDQDSLIEGGRQGGPDRLAAVDHGQDRRLRIEAALDQVVEQGLADGLVLGAALPEPERVLAAIGVDAEGGHDGVLGGLDAVDEEGQQIELPEIAPHQLSQLATGAGHEAAGDGGAGGCLGLQLPDRLQAGSLAAGRKAGQHAHKSGLGSDGETDFEYRGELGTDLWGLGELWAKRVAATWERTVAHSLESIRAEAERRASRRRV